jgi:hypothetical protein
MPQSFVLLEKAIFDAEHLNIQPLLSVEGENAAGGLPLGLRGDKANVYIVIMDTLPYRIVGPSNS